MDNLCEHTTNTRQCQNPALPGTAKCAEHSKGVTQRLYRLANADDQRTLAYLSDHSEIKSLREEIAILRMLIQERVNLAQTDADKASALGGITQSMLAVEKLVKSCHSMEQTLGTLMPKSTVIQIAGDLSRIIAEELEGVEGYEEIVDRIDGRLLECF